MEQVVTLEEVLHLAMRLSVLDKVRLVERIAPEIERDLQAAQPAPRESLRGIWQGLDITDEDIAEVRREMWGNFPREDF
ncbi:MAG: hypothetical protein ACREAB_14400 [Blastocatellia bacterium]